MQKPTLMVIQFETLYVTDRLKTLLARNQFVCNRRKPSVVLWLIVRWRTDKWFIVRPLKHLYLNAIRAIGTLCAS